MDTKISLGRYLCKMYYEGILRPSAFYSEEDPKRKIAKCVEDVIAEAAPSLQSTWISLLAGDLRRLNQMARSRVLGGGASNPEFDWDLRQDWAKYFDLESAPIRSGCNPIASDDGGNNFGVARKVIGYCMASIDGSEGVRVVELVLYYNVGKKLAKLLSR